MQRACLLHACRGHAEGVQRACRGRAEGVGRLCGGRGEGAPSLLAPPARCPHPHSPAPANIGLQTGCMGLQPEAHRVASCSAAQWAAFSS